jgi:oligosaccharide repeat unit polymerase
MSSLFGTVIVQQCNIDFTFTTIFVVLGSISLIFLGEYAGKHTASRIRTSNFATLQAEKQDQSKKITLKVWLITTLILVSIVTFSLYLYDDIRIVRNSLQGEIPNSLSKFYSALRLAKNSGYSNLSIVNHLFSLNNAVALICVFILSYNFYFSRIQKEDFLYFSPIFFYCLETILTSGRTAIENFMISSFVLVYFNYLFSESWKNPRLKRKTTILLVSLGLVFFVSFALLGFVRGSSSAGLNQFQMFLFYLSSPLIALNQYLQLPHFNDTGMFGVHCFNGIYSALHSLFPSFIGTTSMPLGFVYFGSNGLSTNIYTAIRRYIEDFGFICGFIPIGIFGFVYAYCQQAIKRTKNIGALLIFSLSFYAVFEFPIEERFLNEIFSLSFFFTAFYLIALYYLLFTKRIGLTAPKILFSSQNVRFGVDKKRENIHG